VEQPETKKTKSQRIYFNFFIIQILIRKMLEFDV